MDSESRLLPATRVRFEKAVEKFGGAGAVAFSLGCSASTIDGVIKGRRGLGLSLAYRIEKLFHIRMQDWLEPVELESVNVKRIA